MLMEASVASSLDCKDAGGPVVVTGATGYIGGRLVPRLLDAGYRVRCLVREPRKLQSRPWALDPKPVFYSCLLGG